MSKIIVRYEDGSEAEFNPNKPRLLLALEKRFNVQAPERHEHLFWLAHLALAKDEDFDEWVDSIDEVDAEGDDEKDDGEGKADRS